MNMIIMGSMNAVVHTSSQVCKDRLIRLVLGMLQPARGVIWLTTVNNIESTKEIAQMAGLFGVRVVLDYVREHELTPAQARVSTLVKRLWDLEMVASPFVVSTLLGWSEEATACVFAELAALRVIGLQGAEA